MLALTSEVSLHSGEAPSFHFLIRDYPLVFGPLAVAAVACWIAYANAARRLKTPP